MAFLLSLFFVIFVDVIIGVGCRCFLIGVIMILHSRTDVKYSLFIMCHLLLMCFYRTVVFFNPLAHHRTEVVYVIVDNFNVQVTDAEDVSVPCQINPVLDRSSLIVDNQFQVSGLQLFICSKHLISILPDCLNRSNIQASRFLQARYRSCHLLAPSYITELCGPVASIHPHSSLRSAAHGTLFVPRTRLELGKRAFIVAAPAAWNSLPDDIRSAPTLDEFRQCLKTHLFI